jgi:murein DD-endopeptidase MepM/ murein hydrolase activator NlpD/urea transporter
LATLAFAAAGPSRALRGARHIADASLRSYAQILIARSRVSGFLLLAATALDLPTCVGGLTALAGAAIVARAMSLAEGALAEGPYGYNALFAGLAIGHLFGMGPAALALAAAWGGLTVLLVSAFAATAGKVLGLPPLTVPFLLATYLLFFVAPALGLPPRAEMIPVARTPALDWLAWVGALVFVPRIEAGVLVLAALLLHSRVAFLLGAAGALALIPFLRHASLPAATAAPLLFNGVLAAISLGGTWFVPSPASFVLAAAGAALCALVTLALQRVTAVWGVPLLVLPFNLVLLVLLCGMRQRSRDRFPKAVDFAPGSPERNLRFFQTRIERADSALGTGVAFGLPFRGGWICTQGVDGAHTHQGPWRYAFDFEVIGPDGELFVAGESPDDIASYHCHGLPVLAAADGTVVLVENDVPDNPIGGMDLDRNWGNAVMLYHAPGVYSLVAHLASQSVTVTPGQFVKRGEVVGLCGSSGRSPRPHLHFQLQASPTLGAPTLPCRFERAVLANDAAPRLVRGVIPREREIWKNADPDPELAEQLSFPPGSSAVYRVNGRAERVVSEVDLFGQTLLRSSRGGVLYFARTPGQLTILDAEAPPDSILHALRAALGRVPLTADPGVCWHDHLPPAWRAGAVHASLREAIAPFLSSNGLPMEYRCRRDGGTLAVEGRSLRARRDDSPLVVSLAILDPKGWPAVVDVDMARAPRIHAENLAPSPVAQTPRRPDVSRVIHLPTRIRPAPSRHSEA